MSDNPGEFSKADSQNIGRKSLTLRNPEVEMVKGPTSLKVGRSTLVNTFLRGNQSYSQTRATSF